MTTFATKGNQTTGLRLHYASGSGGEIHCACHMSGPQVEGMYPDWVGEMFQDRPHLHQLALIDTEGRINVYTRMESLPEPKGGES